jgi:hypothetical protein
MFKREELATLLAEHMAERSNIVQNWPEDEQEAYHSAPSFAHGNEAVERIRVQKAAEAVLAWFEAQTTEDWLNEQKAKAWDEGAAFQSLHDLIYWNDNPYRSGEAK